MPWAVCHQFELLSEGFRASYGPDDVSVTVLERKRSRKVSQIGIPVWSSMSRYYTRQIDGRQHAVRSQPPMRAPAKRRSDCPERTAIA